MSSKRDFRNFAGRKKGGLIGCPNTNRGGAAVAPFHPFLKPTNKNQGRRTMKKKSPGERVVKESLFPENGARDGPPAAKPCKPRSAISAGNKRSGKKERGPRGKLLLPRKEKRSSPGKKVLGPRATPSHHPPEKSESETDALLEER